MPDYILATAQIYPFKGDIEKNQKKHIDLINLAADHKVQLIVFPELSLTGYEPELADELAFSDNDSRLSPLIDISIEKNIIIIAGAPVNIKGQLKIGAFIFYPEKKIELYTKRYLHSGEEKYFYPGGMDPVILSSKVRASIAVCADINNPRHAADAAERKSEIYLVSAFITPQGYANDTELMKNYARIYNMDVILSNIVGESGGIKAAGRSAFWESGGKFITELDPDREGVLMISKKTKEIQYNHLYL
jgi:predicted amidohydrolase